MWCISLRYGRQRTARQAQLLSLWAQRRQSNKASDSARVDPHVTRPVSPPPRPSEDLDLTVYNRLVIAHSFCSSSPSAGQRGIIRGAMTSDEHILLIIMLTKQLQLTKTLVELVRSRGVLDADDFQAFGALVRTRASPSPQTVTSIS